MNQQQWPPGWYRFSGRVRWWDGYAWTNHYQDQLTPRPGFTPPPAAPRPKAPRTGAVDGRQFYEKKRFVIPAAVIAFLLVVSVLGAIGGAGTGGAGTEEEPPSVDLAQFVSKTPDEAHNQLEDELDVEMTTDYFDFSPVGRDVNRYEDKIVVADRKAVSRDDPKVILWTLRPGEANWFSKHRKMPKVKVGATCEYGYGSKVFKPVDDLVFTANKPGSRRSDLAQKIKDDYEFGTDQTRWPTAWAKDQRKSVGALWESYWAANTGESKITGQRPKAGTLLKPGQLMVVHCSSSSTEDSPPDDGPIPVPRVPNNNDDDFDFPDRLCPTRFC